MVRPTPVESLIASSVFSLYEFFHRNGYETTNVAQKKAVGDFKLAFETLDLLRNETGAALDLLRKFLG